MLLAKLYFFNYFSQMQPETSPNCEQLTMCNIEFFLKYFWDKAHVSKTITLSVVSSSDHLTYLPRIEMEIIVKAMRASFCMTTCSDVAMTTNGTMPPHAIMFRITSDDRECLTSAATRRLASPVTHTAVTQMMQ